MEALLEEWIQPIPTTPDYWNSLAAPDCLLGEQVYFSTDYQNDRNGNGFPNGFYYYKLNSPALHREVKGWVNVRR
jgi:hypothetical protein